MRNAVKYLRAPWEVLSAMPMSDSIGSQYSEEDPFVGGWELVCKIKTSLFGSPDTTYKSDAFSNHYEFHAGGAFIQHALLLGIPITLDGKWQVIDDSLVLTMGNIESHRAHYSITENDLVLTSVKYSRGSETTIVEKYKKQ